jgi:rSAM/selenodomain-associated transferase 1
MRRLALFARAPIEGQVKSRLSPALPPAMATALYAGLLADSLDTLARSTADERLVYWSGPPGEVPFDVHSRTQAEGGLGDRLAAAFDDLVFAPGDKALIVGSDVPGLDPAHIEAAYALLERHDVVLGPSRDGGFWCVGLTWKDAEMFRDIPWGTSEVLMRTAQRAHDSNRQIAYTEWLDDLDTPAELALLTAMLAAGLPACGPRTHAALQAAGLVPAWHAVKVSAAEASSRPSP